MKSVQSETKKTVATLSSEYTKAAKRVAELAKAYAESTEKSGKSSKATKELKTQLTAAQAEIKTLASALKTANNNMVNFSSQTSSAGESLAGAMTKANLLSTAITKIGGVALSAVKSFVTTGVTYNMQMETYEVALTNLLGSAEEAADVLETIKQDAAVTPFDVDSLVSANRYLISSGENAEYARKTILALGDAVSAAGGGSDELNRMAQNLQQVANQGKATSVDIKQFAMAGINIYQILADYTGQSIQDVQEMTVTYDVLTQALIAAADEGGAYYDSMNTQSQTTSGKIATLKDNFKQLTGTLTESVKPALNDVVDWLNEITVASKEAYETDGWSGLADAVVDATPPFSALKEFIQDVGEAIDDVTWKYSKFMDDVFGGENSDFIWKDYTFEEYKAEKEAEKRKEADLEAKRKKNEAFQKEVTAGLWVWDENDGWIPAGSTGSSITGNGGGGGGSGKTSTETVIRSISRTATSKTLNELGVVTQTINTLSEKVKDESGKIKDRITQTTTETGKELVNGVETTYKTVTTTVNGEVTKVTKTYDDMSKSVAKTLVNLATQTIAGVTKSVQTSTQIAADGSESITETVTETWEEVVDGVAQIYTRVTKYIDGIVDSVQESSEEIERTVKASQERIDGYLSEASTQSSKGIFGLFTSAVSAVKSKDWSGITKTVTKLIWGEVDQGQREIITKWAGDAMALINERYAGDGLGGALQAIADLFTDGITPAVDESSAAVKSFGEIIKGLEASGGTGKTLANIANGFGDVASKVTGLLGTAGTAMGTSATNAGLGLAELAAGADGIIGTVLASLSGLLTKVGSLIMSNPEVAAVVAIVAGVAALGTAIWAKFGKSKKKDSDLTYRDIQDAYWYGNERAFAGYDYRTDPYTYNPNNSAVLSYQTKMQEQLQRLLGVVEQYLPGAAAAQIVLDDGTLVGAMAAGMNQQLGNLAVLTERGN